MLHEKGEQREETKAVAVCCCYFSVIQSVSMSLLITGF